MANIISKCPEKTAPGKDSPGPGSLRYCGISHRFVSNYGASRQVDSLLSDNSSETMLLRTEANPGGCPSVFGRHPGIFLESRAAPGERCVPIFTAVRWGKIIRRMHYRPTPLVFGLFP